MENLKTMIRKAKKKAKGVTIPALVITIIILIILARNNYHNDVKRKRLNVKGKWRKRRNKRIGSIKRNRNMENEARQI